MRLGVIPQMALMSTSDARTEHRMRWAYELIGAEPTWERILQTPLRRFEPSRRAGSVKDPDMPTAVSLGSQMVLALAGVTFAGPEDRHEGD